MNFSLENLEVYEDDLIVALISGLNEEDKDIKINTYNYLE